MLAIAALAGAAAGACAVRSVHANLEPGVNLSAYRAYDWAPVARRATGDPRLDNNTIVEQRIRQAVERELAPRGFERDASGAADLSVHYHVSVEERVDIANVEPLEPCESCRPFVYDAGTLVIDLVDARTGKLLWRGWSEGNVSGIIENQRWMEERIDDAVARILRQLPARR